MNPGLFFRTIFNDQLWTSPYSFLLPTTLSSKRPLSQSWSLPLAVPHTWKLSSAITCLITVSHLLPVLPQNWDLEWTGRAVSDEKSGLYWRVRNHPGEFNRQRLPLLGPKGTETWIAESPLGIGTNREAKLLKPGRLESNKTGNMSRKHNVRGDCERRSQE